MTKNKDLYLLPCKTLALQVQGHFCIESKHCIETTNWLYIEKKESCNTIL